MKQTIWKYELKPGIKQEIEMPIGAEILTVQVQHYEVPCLWALVDPSIKHETRCFEVHGTGHLIDNIVRKYIGTFQLAGGSLIYHVFEV